MNEKNEKLTPEQMAAIETAKRQGKISEKEMSELVKVLSSSFFWGSSNSKTAATNLLYTVRTTGRPF